MQCRMRDLRCKEVINISDGCRLGFVSDVDIRIPEGQVIAIVLTVLSCFMKDSMVFHLLVTASFSPALLRASSISLGILRSPLGTFSDLSGTFLSPLGTFSVLSGTFSLGILLIMALN